MLTLLVFSVAFTVGSRAQTSLRVRLDTPRPDRLAQDLIAAGHDVLEGGVGPASLQLVVSEQEYQQLIQRGLDPVVLETGQPYEQIAHPRDGGGKSAQAIPNGYLDLAGVEAQMNAFAAAFPSICQVVDLTALYGTTPTWQGRHIKAVRISDNVGVDEDEPTMLIVSCHHCRELVTPVIALETISNLLTLYGSDPQVTAAVDGHEIWVAPVWNPDGYNFVFTVDNLWRKNRHMFSNGVGVDLNRNYSFGWSSACAGSPNVNSNTYKGTAPFSEAESSTMRAFAQDRNFSKVIDYHSAGREVLWGYACAFNPLSGYLQSLAIDLSTASGYGGQERPPTAHGEHFEWEASNLGSLSFLIETALQFQPSHASAINEAALVWPGILWMLELPVPVTGHVTDACSGQPLAAQVELVEVNWTQGETDTSGAAFGRYHVFAPAGSYTIRFSAPGYVTRSMALSISSGASTALDVALSPSGVGCWTDLGHSLAGSTGLPIITGSGPLTAGSTATLALGNALPNAAVFVILGLANLSLPFKGGVLVPSPDVILDGVQADGSGALTLAGIWPAGVPSGLPTFVQEWIADPGAAAGFAASNGLAAIAP